MKAHLQIFFSMWLIHYLSFPRKYKVFSTARTIMPPKFQQYLTQYVHLLQASSDKTSPGHYKKFFSALISPTT